jgi:predicted RNase H-like HicB family nuclease
LWGVYFPDLPGCVSAAESAEEAIENAEAALKEVAEDMNSEGIALPAARSVEELQADTDIRAALASGAALVSTPIRVVEAAE